jgi:uncharacterized membrane protein (DUF2068 family)
MACDRARPFDVRNEEIVVDRSKSFQVAAGLQLFLSLGAVVMALPMLPRGAEALNQATDAPPYFIVVLTLIVGALGIVSSYGVWRMQKWGVILTLLLRIVDGLAALPGVLFAPTMVLQVTAGIGVVLSIVVIVLLLRGGSRASSRAGVA